MERVSRKSCTEERRSKGCRLLLIKCFCVALQQYRIVYLVFLKVQHLNIPKIKLKDRDARKKDDKSAETRRFKSRFIFLSRFLVSQNFEVLRLSPLMRALSVLRRFLSLSSIHCWAYFFIYLFHVSSPIILSGNFLFGEASTQSPS